MDLVINKTVGLSAEEPQEIRNLRKYRQSIDFDRYKRHLTGIPILDEDDSDENCNDGGMHHQIQHKMKWKEDWPKLSRHLHQDRCNYLRAQQNHLKFLDFQKEIRDGENVYYNKLKVTDNISYIIDLQ